MTHVIVVKMRQVAIVEDRGGVVGEHVADVAGDPFAWRVRGVGLRRRAARRKIATVSGIEQHAGAVGKDEKRGVSASGIDLVNVESPGRPRRQRLSDLLRKGGNREKAEEARKNSHRSASVSRLANVAGGVISKWSRRLGWRLPEDGGPDRGNRDSCLRGPRLSLRGRLRFPLARLPSGRVPRRELRRRDEVGRRRRVGIRSRAMHAFEEQEDLAGTGLEGAASAAEIADYAKSEDFFVEAGGAFDIVNVKGRLEDSGGFWRHGSHVVSGFVFNAETQRAQRKRRENKNNIDGTGRVPGVMRDGILTYCACSNRLCDHFEDLAPMASDAVAPGWAH